MSAINRRALLCAAALLMRSGSGSGRPRLSIPLLYPRRLVASVSRPSVSVERQGGGGGSRATSPFTPGIGTGTVSEYNEMSDDQLVNLVINGTLKAYKLEEQIGDSVRAARIRRTYALSLLNENIGTLPDLPLEDFRPKAFLDSVYGVNCENVIGFVALPVGLVGPLKMNGEEYMVPLATTEGALVASTNRGARAIALSGGASAYLLRDGMTRAPVLSFPSVKEAASLQRWIEDGNNFKVLQQVFDKTSRFGRLTAAQPVVAGRSVHVRFTCSTGDAMGMNMVSKGINAVVEYLATLFPTMGIESLSGNYCTDKKPSAVNWISGRGKSIVVETVLKGDVIRDTLKTNVRDMVSLNIDKNLVGSALAGSIGGNNAHAANMVAAVFLATGQDAAQVVESANCMTLMEAINDGCDLHVSVTMPSIEVGTVGGGTALPAQSACLDLLGIKGSTVKGNPGDNSTLLAKIVATTVLAGEISLMAAHTSGDLVSAHMKLGRKK